MMSIAAPWVAVYMDAILVFQRKGNIYNSYAWKLFGESRQWGLASAEIIPMWIVFLVEVVITWLLLLPFLKHPVLRWEAWLCLVLLWTWCSFIRA